MRNFIIIKILLPLYYETKINTMKTLTILTFLTLSSFVIGQTKWNDFNKLVKQNDRDAIEKFISVWEAASPKDADLYLAKFVYYRNRGVGQQEYDATKEDFRVIDEESIQMALKICERGRIDHPARVDFFTERIQLLLDLKRLDAANPFILKWIDDSQRVSKPWLKSENNPIEDPEFLYKQICNYIEVWLLSTDMDQGPFVALDFANAYAQNYAADPNSLYLLGKVNYKLENLIESEMALLKLLTRSPNHIDALFLMGYITKKTGQFDRSLSYFKSIKKQGVKAERRKAKTEIKALKKEIKAAR